MKPLLFILLSFFSLTIHAQFQEHIIESDGYSASSIISADIDNDGDNDILVSGGLNDQLKWIENSDGLGNFNIEHVIMEQPYLYVVNMAISDMDGDNDFDILLTTGEQDCGEIRTYRNTDGEGNFEVFSLSMYSCGLRGSIGVGDIDGDSDNDWVSSVSSSQFNDSKVSWFENDGNGNVTERIIEESYVRSFQIVDFDGDGDMDLVGFNLDSPINPEIFWYENMDGAGNFDKRIINYNTYLNYYATINVRDLDSDGDLDIIIGSEGQISWYENDGQQNFSDETYIYINNTTVNDWLEVSVVDLDSDGDIDIIATGNDNTIRYYINNGQQNFTEETIIENMYSPYSPISVIDINADNKIDIVSNSSENGKIAWYENTWELSVNESASPKFSIYPNPSKNIVNVQSNIEISQIKVFNQLGSLVLSALTSDNIDISTLETGLYFLKIFTVDGRVDLKKLIRK